MDCSDYARVFNMLSYNCNIIIVANVIYQKTVRRYPDNCPPEENCPRLGFSQNLKGIRTMPPPPPPPPRGKLTPGYGWGLGQGQGQFQGWGATRKLPPRKVAPRLGLEFGLGLVLRLGGNCPRTMLEFLSARFIHPVALLPFYLFKHDFKHKE